MKKFPHHTHLPSAGGRERHLRHSILSLVLISVASLCGCGDQQIASSPLTPLPEPPPDASADPVTVALTKWYGGHAAAISLTYDHGVRWLSWEERLIQDIVRREALPMDFDFTDSDQDEWPARRRYYLDTLAPMGIRFFGHGYDHINSDAVSEDSALHNFRRCYDDLLASGFKPVAYAYPGGHCYAESTRRALAASGFLSGRRFDSHDHTDPYICPDDQLGPKDWYNLPSLVMFTLEFSGDPKAIHNTELLLPFLDEAIRRRSWLITTYHEIKDGNGGTYHVADFLNDIAAVRERDFWIASFNDATLYLRERERARVSISTELGKDGSFRSGEILLCDDLPNDYFNHPLTVRIQLPEYLIGHRLEILQEGAPTQSVAIDSRTLLLSLLPNEHPYTIHPL